MLGRGVLQQPRALVPLQTRTARPQRAVPTQALFGGGKGKGKGGQQKTQRELEREEAYRAQQAVIARRRSGSWLKDVKERRAEVRRYTTDTAYKKQVDDERRERKKREKEEAGGDPAVNPFNIIIPIPPFGLPEYDEGERFDLASPFVDKGYVEKEDGIFSGSVARFFGFGKKQGGDEEGEGKKGKDK